ncbi:MAG TPA: hypothetical protein VG537_11920 [Candidatus Kapabacteria bacterium]|jgi:uncharacterized membrane protein YeaQ/YmgE (transglycosylase-associated protein family)|nr:hypothetical protein [Candidatus Kapabacteria bacterium]
MSYLWIALIGIALGVIAKLLAPIRAGVKRVDPGGCVVSSIVGLIGSIVIGILASVLNISAAGSAVWFVLAALGAIALLAIYYRIIGKRS